MRTRFAGLRMGSHKASQSFAQRSAGEINLNLIFSEDMCLGKYTLRPDSVRAKRVRGKGRKPRRVRTFGAKKFKSVIFGDMRLENYTLRVAECRIDRLRRSTEARSEANYH